ncbi:thiamine pyrophosphate-binding protein [Streptomyces avicenniae]|uniref:thiamine pyrophosphate-binding protein n=1 Tax=Streptomyces avicenniae TaxID=500153 RepID=UPI00069B2ABB|nr:thiamine pyrophosphate-binding protein [Streptomyces avicenniae]
MSADDAYDTLVRAGVNFISGVPDSLLSPLHRRAARRPEIDYFPVCDEATAVGMAAGARLAGARSLVLMENSGLRRACETLARLTMSHRLHTVVLLGRRGAFGEANWWGLPHEETMHSHLRMLPLVAEEIDSLRDFEVLVQQAYATLDTGQCSVALIANPRFVQQLRNVP